MKNQDRKIKKKVDSWLGTLICRSARGDVNTGIFAQRLRGIISPNMAPKEMKKAAQNTLKILSSLEARCELSDLIKQQCTTDKIKERIYFMLDAYRWISPSQEEQTSPTIGEMVEQWAKLTGQDGQDLMSRLYPRLETLVQSWCQKTKMRVPAFRASLQHPDRAVEFTADLLRLMIEETPATRIIEALTPGLQAISKSTSTEIETEMQHIVGEAADFTVWETRRQICEAFESNPGTMQALVSPELTALADYEEQQMGWSDSQPSLDLLQNRLEPALPKCGSIRKRKALLSTLRMIGKRNFLSNMREALKGKLRQRFVKSTLRWLRKVRTSEPKLLWEMESLSDSSNIYKILLEGGK